MRAVLLFCLVLLASAATAVPWILPDPAKPVVAMNERASMLAKSTSLPDIPSLAGLKATVDRPLFSPSRRPPDEAQLAIALTDADRSLILGRYAKTGVVVTGARRIVMLRDTVEGKALRLKEGDRLDGWLIEAIGFATLVLRDGENTLEFDLTAPDKGE